MLATDLHAERSSHADPKIITPRVARCRSTTNWSFRHKIPNTRFQTQFPATESETRSFVTRTRHRTSPQTLTTLPRPSHGRSTMRRSRFHPLARPQRWHAPLTMDTAQLRSEYPKQMNSATMNACVPCSHCSVCSSEPLPQSRSACLSRSTPGSHCRPRERLLKTPGGFGGSTGDCDSHHDQNAPSPRTGTHGAWTGTQLFIWGGIAKPNHWRGCSPSGGCTIVSDGALYDPQADNWTPIASHGSPQGRTGAHVALLGSRVIVFGGFGYSAVEGGGLRTLYDGGIYDPQTDRWDPIGDGSELFQGLNGFRILPTPRAIVVPVNSDGLRYDLTTRTWSQLPPTHFDNENSSLESIAEGEGRFYSNGKDLELQRFDAEKAIWQEAKLPSSTLHHGHDVAWAGDRLVVWRSWIQVHDPGGDNGCRNPDPDIHCDPISPMKSVKRPAGAMIIPVFRNRPGDEADWSRVRVGGMLALFGALAALVGIGFSIRRRRRSRSLGPATAQLQSERL